MSDKKKVDKIPVFIVGTALGAVLATVLNCWQFFSLGELIKIISTIAGICAFCYWGAHFVGRGWLSGYGEPSIMASQDGDLVYSMISNLVSSDICPLNVSKKYCIARDATRNCGCTRDKMVRCWINLSLVGRIVKS